MPSWQSTKTNAAVLFKQAQPLRVIPLKLPDLKPGQLVVDMAYSGVCHSQLLEYLGKRGPDHYLPHTLGHEGSGVVAAVGPDVSKVKTGDHVVLTWIRGKGRDVPSTIYESKEGPVNSGPLTTFMQQTVTCETRVVPIPKNVSLKAAAMLGCAIPTGAGIILNTAKVQSGSSVAIFGVGGVGLSAVLGSVLAKAKIIIAVDITREKLRLAEKLGATHTVNAKTEAVNQKILEYTHGKGVDFAVECAGRKETMEKAYEVTKIIGGVCVLAGNLVRGEKISIDPFHLIQGKKILGTWGGETYPDRDIPLYVDHFLAGRLKLDALITHEYPLSAVNTALMDLKDGKVGRAVLNLKA